MLPCTRASLDDISEKSTHKSGESILGTSGGHVFASKVERVRGESNGQLRLLENTSLQAEGDDTSGSCKWPPFILWLNQLTLFSVRMQPVFTRPPVVTCSHLSTCTSSSGAGTLPLSISNEYYSFSEGSQSNVDLMQLVCTAVCDGETLARWTCAPFGPRKL